MKSYKDNEGAKSYILTEKLACWRISSLDVLEFLYGRGEIILLLSSACRGNILYISIIFKKYQVCKIGVLFSTRVVFVVGLMFSG